MKAELAKEGDVTLGLILYSERADEREYLANLQSDGVLVQGGGEPGTLILLPGGATETGAGGEEDREPATGPSLDSGKFVG